MKDKLVLIQPQKYNDLFSTYHSRKTNSSLKTSLPKMPFILPKTGSLYETDSSSNFTNNSVVQNRSTFSYTNRKNNERKKYYNKLICPLLTFFEEENQNSKNLIPYPSITAQSKHLKDFHTSRPKKYLTNKNTYLKMIYLKLFKKEPQKNNIYGLDNIFNSSNNSIIQNEENFNKNFETDIKLKNYYISFNNNLDNEKIEEDLYMLDSIPINIIDSYAKELANDKNINEDENKNNPERKLYLHNYFFKLVLDSVKHKVQLQNEHNKEISVIWVKNLLDKEIELMRNKIILLQNKQIEYNYSTNSSKFNTNNNSNSQRSISELSKISNYNIKKNIEGNKTDRNYDFDLNTELNYYDLYSMQKNKQLMLLYNTEKFGTDKNKDNKKLLKKYLKIIKKNNRNNELYNMDTTPYITQRITNSYAINSRNNKNNIDQIESNNINSSKFSQIYKNNISHKRMNFNSRFGENDSKNPLKAIDFINEISSGIEKKSIEKNNQIQMVKSLENLNDYKKRQMNKETSTENDIGKYKDFSNNKRALSPISNLNKIKTNSKNIQINDNIKELINENNEGKKSAIQDYITKSGKKINKNLYNDDKELNAILNDNKKDQSGSFDIMNGIKKQYDKNDILKDNVNETSTDGKKNKSKNKSKNKGKNKDKNESKNKSKTNNEKEESHQSDLKDEKTANKILQKMDNVIKDEGEKNTKKKLDLNISDNESSELESSEEDEEEEEDEFIDEEENENTELDDDIFSSSSDEDSILEENNGKTSSSKINKKKNKSKSKNKNKNKKKSNSRENDNSKSLKKGSNDNNNEDKKSKKKNKKKNKNSENPNDINNKNNSNINYDENQENELIKEDGEKSGDGRMEIIVEINEMDDGLTDDEINYLIDEMLEMRDLYKKENKSQEEKNEIIAKRKNMFPIVEKYFIYLMKVKFIEEGFNKDVYRDKFLRLRKIRAYRVFSQLHLKKLEQKLIIPLLKMEKKRRKLIALQKKKDREEIQREMDKIYSKSKKKKKDENGNLIYDSSYLFKKMDDQVNIKKEIQDIIDTDYGKSFFFKKAEKLAKKRRKKKKLDLRKNALFREVIAKDANNDDELERQRRKMLELEELKRKQELRDKRLYDFFARIQKLKDGKLDNFEQELNDLIDEQIDSNTDKEKIQNEIRLNSFMHQFQLNRMKEKFYLNFKNKRIGYLSPLLFKFESYYNKPNK